MNRDIYLVLPSATIGGCERRFFEIFQYLKSNGFHVILICPSILIEKILAASSAVSHDLDLSNIYLVEMKKWNPLVFLIKYYKLIFSLPRHSHFHYCLNCLWFMHVFRRDTVTMSLTNCYYLPSLVSLNKARLWQAISIRRVLRVDVLSPRIYKELRKKLPRLTLSLTESGTCVLNPVFVPVCKVNSIAFAARLIDGKGVLELLSVLPDLFEELCKLQMEVIFNIYGIGPLEEEVKLIVDRLQSSGLKVCYKGFSSIDKIISENKVIMSLQTITNYPSRIVAEALCAGRPVIIRNTGDSYSFGIQPGLYYLEKDMLATDFAFKIVSAINEISSDEDFARSIQQNAASVFSIKKSVSYFMRLWSSVSS